MYDFLDQPVRSLNRGGRLVIWSMRHWVKAAAAGRCTCGDVAVAFETYQITHSLPHFNMMMAVLNQEAITPLRFGAIGCDQVREDEALLISLLRTAMHAPVATMRETAAMIVASEAVGTLVIAFSALAQGLADAGLLPDTSHFDSECSRFPHE